MLRSVHQTDGAFVTAGCIYFGAAEQASTRWGSDLGHTVGTIFGQSRAPLLEVGAEQGSICCMSCATLQAGTGAEGCRMLDNTNLSTLIMRTAQQDRAAFRELYNATSPLFMAIALKILGRRDLAEEAVQDAYVSIWSQAHRFDGKRGSARGWIATIARRRAIDRLRASPWLRREFPQEGEVEARVEQLPEAMTLRHCLLQLKAATRHAICLAYLFGMTHSELSNMSGLPLGTIKSRLRRGLAALRECIGT